MENKSHYTIYEASCQTSWTSAVFIHNVKTQFGHLIPEIRSFEETKKRRYLDTKITPTAN